MTQFANSYYRGNNPNDKKGDWFAKAIAVLCLICGIAAAMIFSGCYTSEKAERQVIKADVKTSPSIVQKYCADKYPPTILPPEIQFVPGDTVEGAPYKVYDTITKDSIIVKPKYIHDTVKVDRPFENTARIKYLQDVIDQLIKDRADSSVAAAKKISVLEDKKRTKNKIITIESSILGLLLIIGLWKLFKKFTVTGAAKSIIK